MASVILLLISPDFLASDYRYSVEMQQAMKRHKEGNATVIPVLLRPIDYQDAPFASLRCLPSNAKPVTLWDNQDAAFLDVAKGIREAIRNQNTHSRTALPSLLAAHAPLSSDTEEQTYSQLSDLETQQPSINKDHQHLDSRPYDIVLSYASEDRVQAEALAQTIRRRGIKVFYDRYEKSTLWGQNLYTYLSDLYQNQANYCIMLLSKHYAAKVWTTHEREAAQAGALRDRGVYILPVRLDDTTIPGIIPTVAYLSWPPENAESLAESVAAKLNDSRWKTVDKCLEVAQSNNVSGNIERALSAYEQAIHLDPYCSTAYIGKGFELTQLHRYEDAAKAYKQGLEIDPHNVDCYEIFDTYDSNTYLHLVSVLSDHLSRYEEALDAIDLVIQLEPYESIYYREKGDLLVTLERFQDAIVTYEQGGRCKYRSRYSCDASDCYSKKASVLERIQSYDKALAAYDEAKDHISYVKDHPQYARELFHIWEPKIQLLYTLQRYEEALAHYDLIIQNDAGCVVQGEMYKRKGDLLLEIRHYEEAVLAYELAIKKYSLTPSDGYRLVNQYRILYNRKGKALELLGRKDEAEEAYNEAYRAASSEYRKETQHQD
jgi:tetratricopeptide (TPR) repeat protein